MSDDFDVPGIGSVRLPALPKLRLSAPLAVGVLAAACIVQHYAAKAHIGREEIEGLTVSMSKGQVGEIKLMRRVIPAPIAWAWGTGPAPTASEAWAPVERTGNG